VEVNRHEKTQTKHDQSRSTRSAALYISGLILPCWLSLSYVPQSVLISSEPYLGVRSLARESEERSDQEKGDPAGETFEQRAQKLGDKVKGGQRICGGVLDVQSWGQVVLCQL